MIAQIGKYTIEKELGHGGFGDVFLAYDPDVEQKVAIKLLRVELGSDPDMLRRFQHEIRTTAGLRHKNIIAIFSSGLENGNPYLVMEFLEGQNLRDVIRSKRPLTLLQKIEIITQVAEGLAFAHSKGIVHRDVKPENIMLLPDDSVKIMDFGIALAPDRNTVITETGGIVGTLLYLAPEQLEGNKAGEQADIFSLGDVYYELLTGEHPFARNKHDRNALWADILTYDPPPVSALAPGLPEALEFIVHTMLAKERGIRYLTVKEFLLDNKAILVDLERERAVALIHEVKALAVTGDLSAALGKLDEAQGLDPGNREARQLREQIHKRQAQDKVAELLTEAESLMEARRFSDAVDRLERAARMDSANVQVQLRLGQAKSKLDSSIRAGRLLFEARAKQQQGHLEDALERLKAAQTIDPDHTEAGEFFVRVRGLLDERVREVRVRQAIQMASQQLAAGRVTDALAALAALEPEQQGMAEVVQLRESIERARTEEERRLRAERLNLAITRTREAMQDGDLDRAGQMIDHLSSNFGGESGTVDVLAALREQLKAQIRAEQIAGCRQEARDLLQRRNYREALDSIDAALRKFPGDPSLERLARSAKDLLQAQQRSEAIATILNAAAAMRDAGDFQGALADIAKARSQLGDEPSFVEFARQLELEIEQQRYAAALEELLGTCRELMTAGKYSEAYGRLTKASEFGPEAEVRALLESARVSAAIEEERKAVAEALGIAEGLRARNDCQEALRVIDQTLATYPRARGLMETKSRLSEQIATEQRRAGIEKFRGAIRREIQDSAWKNAEAQLLQARSEFPSCPDFDDLAEQVAAGLYNARLQAVASEVKEKLAAKDFSDALEQIDATRTIFAHDPRWKALAEQVARSKRHEEVLLEAERHRQQGDLARAELLTAQIVREDGADERARELLRRIRADRSQAARHEDIAQRSQKIEGLVGQGDLDRASHELEESRAKWPDHSGWEIIQAEIQTKQALRIRQAEVPRLAASIRSCIAHEDVWRALSELDSGHKRYPDETVWKDLRKEVEALEASLQRRVEIADTVERVREALNRKDLGKATRELNDARARYPNQGVWDSLQNEIREVERSLIEEEVSTWIAKVRASLQKSDWREAGTALAAARAKHPDRAVWATLQAEIETQASVEHRQQQIRSIADKIREHVTREAVADAAAELEAGRSQFRDESIWSTLQSEIESAKLLLKRRADVAATANHIRGLLEQDDLQNARLELVAAKAAFAGEIAWSVLENDIDRRKAILQRQAGIETVAERIRQCLALEDIRQASADLAAAKAKYPGESLWVTLRTEIDARQAFLKERAALTKLIDEARKLARDKKFPKAQQLIEKNIKQFPDLLAVKAEVDEQQRDAEWENLRTRAEALLTKGDPVAAIQLIEKYASEPYFEPLLSRARLELQRKQNEAKQAAERIEAENRAIAAALAERNAYQAAIEAAIGSRNWTEASRLLDDAVGRFPNERIFRELRAKLSQSALQGDLDRSVAAIRQAFAGGDLEAAERGLDAENQRFYAEPAWKSLREELTRRRHYLALLAEAERRYSQGEHAAAGELLKEAIQDEPPDRRAADLLKLLSAKTLGTRNRRLATWAIVGGLLVGISYGVFVLTRKPVPKPLPPVTLTANPPALNLNCTAGSCFLQQALAFSGQGLSFKASIRSAGGDWLTVEPVKGDSLEQLWVTVKSNALSPGLYDGTVAVELLDTAKGKVTPVPVTLTVAAPTAVSETKSTVISLKPIDFQFVQDGKIPDPQKPPMGGTVKVSKPANWLIVDSKKGELSVRPQGQSIGKHAASLEIQSADNPNVRGTLEVSLTVLPPPPPKKELPPPPAASPTTPKPGRTLTPLPDMPKSDYLRSEPPHDLVWMGTLEPGEIVEMRAGAATHGKIADDITIPWRIPGAVTVISPQTVDCSPRLTSQNKYILSCQNKSATEIVTEIKFHWSRDR